MSRARGVLVVLLLLTVAGLGCHRQATGPKVTDYQKKRAAAIARAKALAANPQKLAGTNAAGKKHQQKGSDSSTFGSDAHGYVYNPVGKKDPFRSFILQRQSQNASAVKGPLEQFDLSQLSLTAVVWKGQRKRALVLDPSGQAYIVAEGDHIGKNEGRVVKIGDDLMVVREAYVDFQGEKTTKEIQMRVRQSQGG